MSKSASLRMTEVSVQPSFGELSEAMSTLGAELSSKVGSMLQTAGCSRRQQQLTIIICRSLLQTFGYICSVVHEIATI